MAKMEANFEQSNMQPRGAIDETFGVVDGVFVPEFTQQHLYQRISRGLNLKWGITSKSGLLPLPARSAHC